MTDPVRGTGALSPPEPPAPQPPASRVGRWRAEGEALAHSVRSRLRGRDLALIGAGLTFYAGIAVVPLIVLAISLTALLTSPEEVSRLASRLGDALPAELGAPDALDRLVDAGLQLDALRGLLALFPMSFYGEGLRRALLRFRDEEDDRTGWRGRLLILPLLLITPLLLYPLLEVGRLLAELQESDSVAARVGGLALGYYSVLFALTLPLIWGFRVVAAGRLRWRAVVPGALFTAACLSGFLQGFTLFLALPLDLGAPFGGLTVVGGVVAVGLWLFLLHLVVIAGWLTTQALHDRLTDTPDARPVAEPAAA